MRHPSLLYLAHGRLGGSSCALMLHYSNWLIGVKNRASLRNASKTPPSPDCNNRGKTVEVQNNNPRPREKTAAFAVANHLLEKGKRVQCTQRAKTASLKSGPSKNIIYPLLLAPLPHMSCVQYWILCECCNASSRWFGCAKVKHAASSAASSSGQRGGRRRAPLPRRRSAKGLASWLEALG